MSTKPQTECKHPPHRLYASNGRDALGEWLRVACCDCERAWCHIGKTDAKIVELLEREEAP